MADDVDRAQERIDNVVEGGRAIAGEKAAKVRALVPISYCYYCGTFVNQGMVFCDADCQHDYHHMLDREQANKPI